MNIIWAIYCDQGPQPDNTRDLKFPRTGVLYYDPSLEMFVTTEVYGYASKADAQKALDFAEQIRVRYGLKIERYSKCKVKGKRIKWDKQ